MSIMLRRNVSIAAAAALILCSAARAEDSGFYLGAGFGEATQSSTIFDGSGTSHRWFVGYSFNRYLAAETGLVDGGTQRDTVGAFDVAASSNGVYASLLGKLPLGDRFAPYAKVGFVAYDATTRISNGVTTMRESESDSDLSYGGGLEFKLGETFRLRADYEKVRVPDVAFDVYTLIAAWHF
jgi:opacity protein-like surface antigen